MDSLLFGSTPFDENELLVVSRMLIFPRSLSLFFSVSRGQKVGPLSGPTFKCHSDFFADERAQKTGPVLGSGDHSSDATRLSPRIFPECVTFIVHAALPGRHLCLTSILSGTGRKHIQAYVWYLIVSVFVMVLLLQDSVAVSRHMSTADHGKESGRLRASLIDICIGSHSSMGFSLDQES